MHDTVNVAHKIFVLKLSDSCPGFLQYGPFEEDSKIALNAQRIQRNQFRLGSLIHNLDVQENERSDQQLFIGDFLVSNFWVIPQNSSQVRTVKDKRPDVTMMLGKREKAVQFSHSRIFLERNASEQQARDDADCVKDAEGCIQIGKGCHERIIPSGACVRNKAIQG